jgi:hypothetical protein
MYGSFSDSVHSGDYTASNDGISDKQSGKQCGRRGSLLNIRHLSGGTEENHEKPVTTAVLLRFKTGTF